MLDKKTIQKSFELLNEEIKPKGVKGEICLYGGAVMCVAFDARPSTKDVDAVFKPAEEIREAAKRVARDMGLLEDWLNDGVKGFLVEHPRKIILDLSNLKIFIPEPDYLLAMKALASRADTSDAEDVRFLIKKLGLEKSEDVFRIVEKYYSREQVRPATRFFIEEIFSS